MEGGLTGARRAGFEKHAGPVGRPSGVSSSAPPPAPFEPRRLLLVFGAVIALGNLVGWAVADLHRFGAVTARGPRTALLVASAVLALYLVVRAAEWITARDAA